MVEARKKRAVRRKPSETATEKKKVGRGTAKMKAAADKALEKNSEEIAESLVKKTIAGNSTSARLLFALAEGQIDCADGAVVRHRSSEAEKLASEPEWDGGSHEAEGEIGLGQRESEG
ncbi:MAG: hypothetical protein ABSC76_17835 [Terracidiphilus sp.]|jgi:hypothetical protein